MSNLLNEDIYFLMEMRSFGYDFLKHIFFIEPSKEFLDSITYYNLLNNFPFINDSNTICEGINSVKCFLHNEQNTYDKGYEKLHWDYTRMFIGPNFLLAPPWESVYLSDERLLFQNSTLEVRNLYLKHCFVPNNYPHEADDHIGFELDFMYKLSQMSMEEKTIEDRNMIYQVVEEQEKFLQEHLLKWVPDFSENVIKNADTSFYIGMANILMGFLELDSLLLKELLEKMKT